MISWTQRFKKLVSTSFIPMVSLPLIPFSFTYGNAQKMSGNFDGWVICDSYFVFTSSTVPVKDFMNSRLSAEWIQLDWFSNHNLSFSSPETSFIILVLSTISFSLVLGEVKQTLILLSFINWSSFFLLLSSL